MQMLFFGKTTFFFKDVFLRLPPNAWTWIGCYRGLIQHRGNESCRKGPCNKIKKDLETYSKI